MRTPYLNRMGPALFPLLSLLTAILLLGGATGAAFAQDKSFYPELQILVPGEEPAPGSATGKTGTPEPQQLGVPFQVRVRACNSEWEPVAWANHLFHISSTDDQATLPLNTPMTEGELITWVTLNSEGNFTITAQDMTAWQNFTATSPLIRVVPPTTEASYLAISDIPWSQTAGQAVHLTISARRADGSLDASQNGSVALHQLTSLGQGVVSPTSIDLSGGTWSGNVTFYLADPTPTSRGSVHLKANHTSSDLAGLSNSFHVGPGPYSRLLVILPGQNWTPWIVGGLNGTPDQQWADGPFYAGVYATDEWWNRVAVNDMVQLESGDANATTPAEGALVEGHLTFQVTMRTPGRWFLAVSDLDQPEIGGMVSADVPVWYSNLLVLLPGEEPDSFSASGKTGTPQAQIAGVPFPVRIRACNADFAPVPTDRVVVRLSSTDDTATLPAAAPMNNGELVAQVKMNSAGNFTLTAEDIVGPEYYVTTTEAVSVSGSTGVVAGFQMVELPPYQTAGTPSTATIYAVDADGNRVHSYGGTVDLSLSLGTTTGRMEPTQVSFQDGAWTGPVTFFTADEGGQISPDGNCRLLARSATDPALAGQSNNFRVSPGALARLQLVLPGQSLAAPGHELQGAPATQTAGQPFYAQIFATDTWLNQVNVGHTIRLESEDPEASTPVQTVLDQGQASVAVTLGSEGNWVLTARDLTDTAVPTVASTPISVLSNNPVFEIVTPAGPLKAGEPVTVTIVTLGPDGRLLDDFDGHAMLAAATGPETITPATIQFSEGRWTGEVTMFAAREQTTFSCLDYASPPNTGVSDPIQVLPGDFVGLQVLLPGQENDGGRQPGFVGEIAEQTAGTAFPLAVRAVDSWWNLVPGVDLPITLDGTDPFAEYPETAFLTDGILNLPITFKRAGSHTVTAAVDSTGIATHTSGDFPVQAGPYARIIALAPGEELLSGSENGRTGLALDQSISRSFVLRTQATDHWWNPVTGVSDLIGLTCTDPLAVVPENFSLLNGYAEVQVKLSSAGYQLMTLSNLSNPDMETAHTQMRAIESGFHIEAEVHPGTVTAGEPFTLSVRIVNDAGAVMTDVNGEVEVTVLNSVTQAPGGGELLASSFQVLQGVRSVSQTYTRSEPVVLVISSPQAGLPGITNVLTVVPGEPASLEFHETPAWVGGRQTTDIHAKVADTLGNGVPGQQVVFALAEGVGLLEVANEITDENGLATAHYTGSSSTGSGLIQVAAAGFTTSMMIMTSLMDPGSSGGTISNYPNPFHPGEGSTTISYVLARNSSVTTRLFTLSGTLVFQRRYEPGSVGGSQGINEIEWDGRNGEGEFVASGGYILYVEAQDQGETIHQIRRRIAVVR